VLTQAARATKGPDRPVLVARANPYRAVPASAGRQLAQESLHRREIADMSWPPCMPGVGTGLPQLVNQPDIAGSRGCEAENGLHLRQRAPMIEVSMMTMNWAAAISPNDR
jgi:hypothetical protein